MVGETLAEATMLTARLITLGFVALLLLSKGKVAPHPDTQRLVGAWEIEAVEREGKPDPTPVGFTLRFINDEVHFQVPLDSPLQWTTVAIDAKRLEAMAFS